MDGYALDAAIGVAKSGKSYHGREPVPLKQYHHAWSSPTLKQSHHDEEPVPLKQYHHV